MTPESKVADLASPPEGDARRQGETAARQGLSAAECPYETGRLRREWVAGFFAAKPPTQAAGLGDHV